MSRGFRGYVQRTDEDLAEKHPSARVTKKVVKKKPVSRKTPKWFGPNSQTEREQSDQTPDQNAE